MEINNFEEARLAKTDGHTRSAYYVDRGKELLGRNMPDQAEAQFRSAIGTDNGNAAAHAELAMILERKGDVTNARTEAETSVRLKPNVDGLLVLARLDLKQNQVPAAMAEVNRALALEPGNAPAASLKRDIAAKQTGSQ